MYTFLVDHRRETGCFGIDYSIDEIITPVPSNVQGSVTMLILKSNLGSGREKKQIEEYRRVERKEEGREREREREGGKGRDR